MSVLLCLAIRATAFVVILVFFFRIFFRKMPPKSRAARRLMPNNRSPDKSGRKRTRKEPDAAKNRHDEDRSCS